MPPKQAPNAAMQATIDQLIAQNNQLMQVNNQLLQALQNQQNMNQAGNQNINQPPNPPAPNLSSMSSIVQKKNPPTFNGKGDPEELEDWIRDMEKIFLSVGCPDEFRIRIVVYYLKGFADALWTKVAHDFMMPTAADVADGEPGEHEGTWNDLKEILNHHFFPEHMRRAKRDEFENLQQCKLTVKEFYNQFMELEKYADPMTAPTRARIFEKKLNKSIRARFSGETFTRLATVYERAYNTEVDNLDLGLDHGQKRKDHRGNDLWNHNKKGKSSGNFDGKSKSFGGTDNRGSESDQKDDRPLTCFKCDKDFHPGFTCDGRKLKCNWCSIPGHFERDCMNKMAGKPPVNPDRLNGQFRFQPRGQGTPATSNNRSNNDNQTPARSDTVNKPAGSLNATQAGKRPVGNLYAMTRGKLKPLTWRKVVPPLEPVPVRFLGRATGSGRA